MLSLEPELPAVGLSDYLYFFFSLSIKNELEIYLLVFFHLMLHIAFFHVTALLCRLGTEEEFL